MVTDMTTDVEKICAMKDEGNLLYKAGNYLKAAAVYSQAIKMDKENHVLYSNRCAALIQLSKVKKALQDAETCIKLKPEWEKGYFRKGTALERMDKTEEALNAYREAAEYNPNNIDVANKIKVLTRLVQKQKRIAENNAKKAKEEAK